jgi:hypothetical protein
MSMTACLPSLIHVHDSARTRDTVACASRHQGLQDGVLSFLCNVSKHCKPASSIDPSNSMDVRCSSWLEHMTTAKGLNEGELLVWFSSVLSYQMQRS